MGRIPCIEGRDLIRSASDTRMAATRTPLHACARLSHGPHRTGEAATSKALFTRMGQGSLRPIYDLTIVGKRATLIGRRWAGRIDLTFYAARATVPSMSPSLSSKTKRTTYYKYAVENGWNLDVAGSGHLRARKDGHLASSLSMTPGGGRAQQNCLAKLVRCDKGKCHCHLRHPALVAAG